MAEIEISIFRRRCLSRRMECLATLRRRINRLPLKRNWERCTISWRFTTNDAREKLQDLYPDLKNANGKEVRPNQEVCLIIHLPDCPCKDMSCRFLSEAYLATIPESEGACGHALSEIGNEPNSWYLSFLLFA